MTQKPDLTDLRKIVAAATPGPWTTRLLMATQKTAVHSVDDLGNYAHPVVTRGISANNAEHVATFDPPTVLELIERAEAAEQALDFHTQRDRELKSTLAHLSDRLDEHCYDEFASLIDDGPLDQWGESYKSRLEQAEAQIARVRELHHSIPVTVNFDSAPTDYCRECYDLGLLDAEYKCPTIRALDGGQA